MDVIILIFLSYILIVVDILAGPIEFKLTIQYSYWIWWVMVINMWIFVNNKEF